MRFGILGVIGALALLTSCGSTPDSGTTKESEPSEQPSAATPDSGVLKAVVLEGKPFAAKQGDTYEGFAVDVINHVKDEAGLSSVEFVPVSSVSEGFQAITSGKADITPAFETEIERFAYAATQLGRWIDGNDGPSDLGCIFRGMAEEGVLQLDALEEAGNARDTRDSLLRLAVMFSDAEVIAAAATQSALRATPALDSGLASCPVNTAAAKAALK